MQYRAVIFDMDGTLLNSLEDLADSVEELLSFYGCPGHTLEEYRYFVGNGPRKLIQRSLPKDMAENETFVDEALVRYKGIYEKNMMNKSKPYEGILEMLGKLQQKGIPLAVCTNKQEPAARLIAAKLFPAGIFREIVGDVPGQARKPDPSRALQIAEPSIEESHKPTNIPKTSAAISLNGRELVKPLLLMLRLPPVKFYS